MARAISLTEDHLKCTIADFLSYLKSAKITDGKISYTGTLGKDDRKAEVRFSDIAWEKMNTLVREFTSEVGWHGTARRSADDEENVYFIDDIFVYPQVVSGVTVNTDQKEYDSWLANLSDEVFDNLRMHGHSHVNMSTSPSIQDDTHREGVLSRLKDDMFYIFLIWNKRGEHTIKIYDRKKNVMFDSSDITVKVGESDMETFLASAKEIVKAKSYQPVQTKPAAKEPDKTAKKEPEKKTESKKDAKKELAGDKKAAGKKRKGHRKKPESKRCLDLVKSKSFGEDDYMSNAYGGYYDDDDYTNPYSAFGCT